jgi:FAD-dependent oxidoreductase domain-containing protein 1
MSRSERVDVVIVGGAIVGSSVGTFLAAEPAFNGRVMVVERDPTYATSATALSAASIRQQFSTAINIEISRFGIELIKHLDRYLAVDGEVPQIDFVEGGYLFLATDAGLPILERNHALQRSLQVQVALLSSTELRQRFAWLNVEDLAAGSLGLRDEGWFDAYALLRAFRAKARSLGVEYVTGEVVEIDRDGERVTGIALADGRRIACDWAVNAAGPRAAAIARLAGLELPVRPRKRYVYHFDCRTRIADAPLTIDPSGVYFRPEGQSYIGGYSPRPGEPDPDALDLEVDRAPFEEVVWPSLAHRVPAFESIRLLDAWAGHYEINTLDHNAVIGPHPVVRNFLFANGFSGHGLQQAPAVGRGLAEWISHGEYRSLDLSRLGYGRIVHGAPHRELNVV